MKETFEQLDRILPVLSLENPCYIKIDITDEYVYLHVGRRDWQWYRTGEKKGELMGCGTVMLGTMEDNEEPKKVPPKTLPDPPEGVQTA